MNLPITSIVAVALSVLFIALSRRVIRLRHKYKIGVGDGDRLDLRRAIRAQGNFAEYVPFLLILLALCELQGATFYFMVIVAIILVVGRTIHAIGISAVKENVRWRVAGMVGTFVPMVACVLQLLYLLVFA